MLGPERSWSALHWQTDAMDRITAGEFIDCFTESGAAPLADRIPLLLPIAPEWLVQGEFIQKFRSDQAVFVLPEHALDAPTALAECAALRKRGYHFALRVDHADAIRRAPLTAFDHLLLDAAFSRHELPALELIYCDRVELRRIATGVASQELFDWLAAKRFALCDSAFLTAPDAERAPDPDAARVKMLKLLSLVVQDAETRAIEEVFREEPKLSYNLLRLVNSVAIGGMTQISSFNQAIAILGRRQLQRWLQLLLYTAPQGGAQTINPLLQLAATRGRLMELLAEKQQPQNRELVDHAFMTGIMSLMPALLGVAIADILGQLPVAPRVKQALCEHGGTLGNLLRLVESTEHAEAQSAEEALRALPGLNAQTLSACLAQALAWANNLGRSNA